MRLGLFLALFAGLAVVISISVPIPNALAILPANGSVALTLPRCFDLAYESPATAEYLPSSVRLLPELAPDVFVGGRWRRIRVSPEIFDARLAAWRPVGSDSIDIISYYHSPLIRLPLNGHDRVGRITTRGYTTLFEAFFYPDQPVRAREVACGPTADSLAR